MEDKNKELAEAIKRLNDKLEAQCEKHNDLLDYLQRTDKNFHRDSSAFDNWESRLDDMRHADYVNNENRKAKNILEQAGYIVLRDESELDAVKLKHWVTSKEKKNDLGT